MSRAKVLLLLALFVLPQLAPSAVAHGSEKHEDGPAPTVPARPGSGERPTPVVGGQGDIPYYSYYEGGWLYGDVRVTRVGYQYIRGLAASGDWLVWEDAKRSDIFAFNLAAGEGVYVTGDRWRQTAPSVSGSFVVWEDRRNGHLDVYGYDFDSGETVRVTSDPADQRNPHVGGNWIVWEDNRGENWDVWAYDRVNRSVFRVSEGDARSSDPVIVGEYVLWRTYRFNVWDVAWYNLATGERGSATADRLLEQAPFGNGRDALFLKELDSGWRLMRWRPSTLETVDTGLRLRNPILPTASGDHLVQVAWDGGLGALIAHNLTNRYGTPVSSPLPLMDSPLMHRGVVYVPTWNGTEAAVLAFDVNPFAFIRPPELVVDTPAHLETLIERKVRVAGTLRYEGAYVPPAVMRYTVDGGRSWTEFQPGPQWSFMLDVEALRPARYTLRVVAEFDDIPPILEELEFIVPASTKGGADVGDLGEQYHRFRVMTAYAMFFQNNPASWGVLALTFALVGLLVARWRLKGKPRRRVVVEYVRPSEE